LIIKKTGFLPSQKFFIIVFFLKGIEKDMMSQFIKNRIDIII